MTRGSAYMLSFFGYLIMLVLCFTVLLAPIGIMIGLLCSKPLLGILDGDDDEEWVKAKEEIDKFVDDGVDTLEF